MVLRLDCDKKLVVVKTTTVYRGESGCSEVRVLVPRSLLLGDWGDYQFTLFFKNEKGEGDAKYLVVSDVPYSDGVLSVSTLIDRRMTDVSGQLEMWVHIACVERDFLLKSSSARVRIEVDNCVDEVLGEVHLSLLEQWEKRMMALEGECRRILAAAKKARARGEKTAEIAKEMIRELRVKN